MERRDFAGRQTVYRYDALGRQTAEWGWDGNEYRYRYDASGNLIAADSPESELRFGYDRAGRLIMSEDRLSRGSRIEYVRDERGLVVTERWRQAAQQVHYRYNHRGQIASITDPDGRLAAVVSEAGGAGVIGQGRVVDARVYAYTPAALQMAGVVSGEAVRANARTGGELPWSSRTRLSEAVGAQVREHANRFGLVTPRAEQESWTTRYRYDSRENRISWDSAWAQRLPGATASPSTPKAHRLKAACAKGVRRGQLEYEYNAANYLVGEGQRRYEYDREGTMTVEQLAGVSEVRYDYDARGRVIAVERDYEGLSELTRATAQRFGSRNPQEAVSEQGRASQARHGGGEILPPGRDHGLGRMRHLRT